MGEPLKTGGSQFGDSLVRPSGPSLPPRKSSDQSTMDVHKQLALRDSSNTVETVAKEGEEGPAISRAMSVERELHPAKGTTSAPSGPSKDTDAAPQQGQQATAAQKVRCSSRKELKYCELYLLMTWTWHFRMSQSPR